MSQVIRVLLNGQAGSVNSESDRSQLLQQLATALPDAIVRWTDANVTMDQLIQQAMKESPTMVVAGGGDGTINAVASAIVGTDTVLGVLPVGTLNHFAKDAGIPTDLAKAVTLLRDGVVKRIDVGTVNDRIFLNNAGLGIYPEIVRHREAQQRHGASKWPAAIAATARVLYRYRELGLRLRMEGTTLLRRTPALFVGNNEYCNDDTLEPYRKTLSAGTLSVFIPSARGPLPLLWFTLRALIGSIRNSRGFEMLLVDRFTIESRSRNLNVSIDGEVVSLPTPLHFSVQPSALRILASDDHTTSSTNAAAATTA